jgi:hypothetical protein
MTDSDTNFRVGISPLNPAKPFLDLWYQLNSRFSDYKLHLVPFDDNHTGILSESARLGDKFDFLIGECDSKLRLHVCNILPIERYRKMCAISRNHPLSRKKRLDITDLYGETLMMVKPGNSGVNDLIRKNLQKEHPQIRIKDTPGFYDISVFNRCAETNHVLLSLECWRNVHPALVTLPAN